MEIYFSVIMPTYNQAAFIRRAILSLQRQTHPYWELIIVNDGSTDETETFIADLLKDPRISYIRNEQNRGLGQALNRGMERARYDHIAYLPSDDYFYNNHLETIATRFRKDESLVLAYTGMRYESPDTLYYTTDTESNGIRKGYCLQLVQTAHRKTSQCWPERSDWVTEDLFAMFWRQLSAEGTFGTTNSISCHWSMHPAQRHRLLGERYGGGINKYRAHYHVQTPIRMKVSKYKFIDEEKLYAEYRKTQSPDAAPLKILLVGELAYNPERIYALEEAGHRLYGLWTPHPMFSFSTVGHLPFGHVEDLDFERWREEIERVHPDVIYAQLNFGAVPLAYDVMRAFPHIPFVWHFKEGPSVCLRNGDWHKLIYLYAHADGKIFLNDTVRCWFEQFMPPVSPESCLIMDGDLPKRACFKDCFSAKLSAEDGAIHTVVAGRMIGLSDNDLRFLARNDIHIHLYTENYHASREKGNAHWLSVAPGHFHLHDHVSAANWTEEFSRYDAGWLHCFRSRNGGDLMKAGWDDLNIPARISAYAAAGIPVIQSDNREHTVATQSCIRKHRIGILFSNMADLSNRLKDKEHMKQLQENMMSHRMEFCFDHYVPQLITLFRNVIKNKRNE